MQLTTGSSKNFAQIPGTSVPRSAFRQEFSHKTTFDVSYLIPFYVDEVLPASTFNFQATVFARMATPTKPFMDSLFLNTYYFFVPNRLLWDNWTKFMGEQTDPGDSISYTIPQITCPSGGWTTSSLPDYFGVRIGTDNLDINALFTRAYNLIYNEWFRDENIIDSATVDKGDGPDTATNYVLRKKAKPHDYFTSALPWAQKFDAINMPLGGLAPVEGLGKDNQTWASTPVSVHETGASSTTTYANAADLSGGTPGNYYWQAEEDTNNSGYPGVFANLASATGVSVNELRENLALQRLQERDARGGTRYPEIIKSHFGVTDPQMAVLQRPEYLGGSKQLVDVTPVPQNSESNTTKQGNMAAFATVTDRNGFTKSFTEHGVILGLMCVSSQPTYQQGIPKMFSRSTREDFYFPELANLGEQAILNKEVYAQGTSADTDVFGYQERWSEYRYYPNKVTDKFRSDATGTLDVWHVAEDFNSLPTLSQTFIEDQTPIDRVLAVTDEKDFYFDSFMRCTKVLPMPTHSIPSIAPRF